MARIDSYSPDDNIIGSDKLIGTDNATGITKNFNLDSIKDWLNKSGGIRIAGQSNYRFQSLGSIPSDRIGQTISFESFGGDNTAFSDITEMVFSSVSASGSLTPEYISTLVDKLVLISDLTNSNNFGVYILTSFDEIVEEPTFYKAVLSFAYGNGTIKADESYGFIAYGLPNDGVTWGTIVGSLTDQTDLVNYVKAERPNYPISSPDGTSFIIVAGNDGTLAAIPPTSTAPSITTLPTISGTLNVGETLTATAGTTSGIPTPTTTLQWQRSDNGTTGWADISGATGTTYLLGYNDEDKYIRAAQTEENILGTATANSASTGQIQPAAFSGLLDDHPNAAAAYSLRKLRNFYVGDAIIVRRASDNTTQSIGFVNGELDTASLESFCAGTDGFVTTWFDQSGNENDVAQTTAGYQPKIVSSGSTITESAKPSIDFLGNQYFPYGSIAFGYDANIVAVLKSDNESPTGIFAVQEDAGATYGIQIWNHQGTYTSWNSTTSNVLKDTETATNKFAIIQAGRNTISESYMRINSVDFSITPSSQDISSRDYYIGTIRSNDYFYDGRMSEFVVYNQNMYSDLANIETNINDFYNIY
jgi:hypothetical protein